VESGFRYTPSSTFETFPFTWPPGKEDQSDPKVQAIAEAARELVRLRDEWLGGGDPHPPPPSPAAAGEGEERGHADPLPSPIAEGEERGHADLLSSPIAMGEGPGVRAGGEPRALPDQISGLPDQGAGLSDQGGTLPDQGSGLSDKPEALPDKPGGLSDQADAGRGLAGAQPGDQQAPSPKPQAPGLKDRTLTNLYNKRPDWLVEAHRRLDAAVFDAYGWPSDPSAGSGQALSDGEILARLLALNLERAAGQGAAPAVEAETDEE